MLEIGPGRGHLTLCLAMRARNVLAVELDGDLLPILRAKLADCKNCAVIHGDILKIDLFKAASRFSGRFKIIGNIPYYLTSELLIRLLTSGLPFDSLSVMVQAEAAEKITAFPGKKGYGPLSIYSAFYSKASVRLMIPAECFVPPPRVESAFVRLDMLDEPRVKVTDVVKFFMFIERSFTFRRKTLTNNLLAGTLMTRDVIIDCIKETGLPSDIRAERMSLEDFAALFLSLSKTQD